MAGKALFLDRDGVVNVDGGYVHRIEDFRLVPGILNLCRQAKEKGYLVLVATNQSGIGRGMFSEDDFERLTEYMRGVFRSSGAEIAGVFHCPSADDGHPDRKPNPGLFLKAAAAHGLDMKACVSVGDRRRSRPQFPVFCGRCSHPRHGPCGDVGGSGGKAVGRE